jgi:hypothetical protein
MHSGREGHSLLPRHRGVSLIYLRLCSSKRVTFREMKRQKGALENIYYRCVSLFMAMHAIPQSLSALLAAHNAEISKITMTHIEGHKFLLKGGNKKKEAFPSKARWSFACVCVCVCVCVGRDVYKCPRAVN